ncbi:hypothetical protein F443_19883, partial [Phytophthora nicotianae P1569]
MGNYAPDSNRAFESSRDCKRLKAERLLSNAPPRLKGLGECSEANMRTACTLTKIENSLLPDKISALFHVVEIIDEMLMSPEEAVIKSAGTNQLRWINRLLETFDGDLTAVILRAAANGHLDMMQRLVHEIGERAANESHDMTKNSMILMGI